ncbi:hypothetical protein RJ53_05840 [Methanocalculus chunghsingensis]|uniref:GntP family permease n=1 Tax=Methanocalculus chunghsingensis TaxID=156457 RepID=A0A8J7W9U2_9EURY|nr:hypothetical protein [Methanocalculus chunghsingensis]
MDALPAFFICIIAITVATAYFRLPPFPVLFSAALLFGGLSGLDPGMVIHSASTGAGRVFAILGVAVWGGSIIAASLASGNGISRLLADLRTISGRPGLQAGLAGWLLAVPFMCAITPFLVLAPLFQRSSSDPVISARLLSIIAIGSVFSFVLIAPAPVMATLLQTLTPGVDPVINRITLPLSFLLLTAIILVLQRGISADPPDTGTPGKRIPAWAPIATPVIIILAGFLIPGIGILGSLPIAFIAGAGVALLLMAPDLRKKAVNDGTKHAGVIIFDLCGAGAFGGVIAASSLPGDAIALLGMALPLVILPFFLAAIIQTAQGSRVVTAVITADLLSATTLPEFIPALPLLLMIAAGTMVISFASDPFFWLINRTTNDSVRGTFITFTLPLAGAGLATFLLALLLL